MAEILRNGSNPKIYRNGIVYNDSGGGSATLITKSISTNGTYNASSDNADGYSSVTVSVPATITTLTPSAYDALPTAQKNNGTLYKVTELLPKTVGVVSLIHFDDYSLLDESGKTWVMARSYYNTDSNYYVFGGQSYKLMAYNGGNNYITAGETYSDFNFGSNDFTIDLWVRPNSISSRQAIFSMSPSGGGQYRLGVDMFNNGKINMWMGSSGNSWNVVSADNGGNGAGTIALTTGTWQHIALVRNGEYLTLYVDGNQSVQANVGTASVYWGNGLFRIGMWNNATTYVPNMLIDEFCVRNYAVWTTEFTPPTEPYRWTDESKTFIYYMNNKYSYEQIVTS